MSLFLWRYAIVCASHSRLAIVLFVLLFSQMPYLAKPATCGVAMGHHFASPDSCLCPPTKPRLGSGTASG